MGKYQPGMTDFDKVTIITGGTRGIGAGCARAFVQAGAPVMIAARGKDEGEALAAELTALGPGACRYEPCDVTREEDLRRVVEKTVQWRGRLDCLINNAGWHPDKRPIDGFSVEEFEQLLRLNVVSYFLAAKFALPHLRKTHGSIINMGSLVGSMGQEWSCTYVAAKGAIAGFTKALAVDEARHGVRVNAVLPGTIATPSAEHFIANNPDPEGYRAYLHSWQWTGRPGTLEEAGQTCLFLASDGASFVTGMTLNLSGGAELAYGIKKPRFTEWKAQDA